MFRIHVHGHQKDAKPRQKKGALSHKQRALLLKSPLKQKAGTRNGELKNILRYRLSSAAAKNFTLRTKNAAYVHAFFLLRIHKVDLFCRRLV